MTQKYVQTIDELGRLLIPVKIRRELQFEAYQEVEITIEYGKICIKKYEQQDIKKVPYLGMIRALDKQDRLVIPRDYMRVCKIERYREVEISLVGEKIEISID